jgi:hypothetical protein
MQGQLFSTATSRMACPALRRTKTSGRSVQSACRVRAGTRSSDLRAALDATGHWYRPPFLKIVQIIPTPLERSVCFPLIRANIPKEVVLTFDDGPVPRYSNQILDILADNGVKARRIENANGVARRAPRWQARKLSGGAAGRCRQTNKPGFWIITDDLRPGLSSDIDGLHR